MRGDLRAICKEQIARIKELSDVRPLIKEEIENLKGLATALKTLEDSKAPETDDITEAFRIASVNDILKVLDETENDY